MPARILGAALFSLYIIINVTWIHTPDVSFVTVSYAYAAEEPRDLRGNIKVALVGKLNYEEVKCYNAIQRAILCLLTMFKFILILCGAYLLCMLFGIPNNIIGTMLSTLTKALESMLTTSLSKWLLGGSLFALLIAYAFGNATAWDNFFTALVAPVETILGFSYFLCETIILFGILIYVGVGMFSGFAYSSLFIVYNIFAALCLAATPLIIAWTFTFLNDSIDEAINIKRAIAFFATENIADSVLPEWATPYFYNTDERCPKKPAHSKEARVPQGQQPAEARVPQEQQPAKENQSPPVNQGNPQVPKKTSQKGKQENTILPPQVLEVSQIPYGFTLVWTPSPSQGAITYRIIRAENAHPAQLGDGIEVFRTSQLIAQDTRDLELGKEYGYAVYACRGNDCSSTGATHKPLPCVE